jgi:hypothetical protein
MEYDIDEEDNFIGYITHKNKITNNSIKMVICFLCGSYPTIDNKKTISHPHKCLFNKTVRFKIEYISNNEYYRHIILPPEFNINIVRRIHYYSIRYYNTCDKNNYNKYLEYKYRLYWHLPENKKIIYYLVSIIGIDLTKLVFLHIL